LHAALDEHAPASGDTLKEAAANDTRSAAISEANPAEQQLRRMERQAGVLERAAEQLAQQ
jgi:hypothetical protein